MLASRKAVLVKIYEGRAASIEGYTLSAAVRKTLHFMHTASRLFSKAQHHPEWENRWISVRVWLTSWDIGHRPSQKDVALAEELDRLYRHYDH